MSARIYDISPPITEALAVWPGDTPPHREVLLDLARGDAVTLSTLHATVHLGAHADGPNHFGLGAPGIDGRSLEDYLGPCQVVRVKAEPGCRIGPAALRTPILAPRVLLHTGTFPDPQRFRRPGRAADPSRVARLARRHVYG